jgi:hypothetical protein
MVLLAPTITSRPLTPRLPFMIRPAICWLRLPRTRYGLGAELFVMEMQEAIQLLFTMRWRTAGFLPISLLAAARRRDHFTSALRCRKPVIL